MGKNIVIFADGTGQEGGVGNNTNVYDLFNMIEDRTERQVSFYDRGLGTGWRKITGNIGGAGITKNVQECYEFISNCYNAGDQIYLFGFSRGAATVRTLAAFIHRFGILPRSRPELIKRAYGIYKIRNKEKRRKQAKKFVERNHTMWCRIRFLGVWDTVAALGLPIKLLDILIDQIPFFGHSFHDLRLSNSVDFARHAVAIDDERLIFHPTLWDEREEQQEKRKKKTEPAHCSADDITDIYLVAEKLKATADPISKHLNGKKQGRFAKTTRQMIDDFDPNTRRQESVTRSEALKTALAGEFNQAIEGESLYNPDEADLFAGMQLSRETQERIERNKTDAASVRRLNRLLLEDAYLLRPADPPRVKQAWFAGMHTDVGGGYAANELAHVPLMWMVKEAMDVGLLIYESHKVNLRPDATGKMHNSRAKLARFYRRRVRFWDTNKNQGKPPLVHESVLIRHRCEDCSYEPWILKMKYELEPWPKRLTSSVQFDDYYIWREGMWGWGAAFTVPWNSVKRVSHDELRRTITLEVRDKDPIVIKGSLSKGIRDLSAGFERRKIKEREEADKRRLKREDERQKREDERQKREDERQKREDERLARQDATLTKIVEEHTEDLRKQDEIIHEQIKKLEIQEQRLREQDKEFKNHITAIKEQIADLNRAEPDGDVQPAESTKRQKRAK